MFKILHSTSFLNETVFSQMGNVSDFVLGITLHLLNWLNEAVLCVTYVTIEFNFNYRMPSHYWRNVFLKVCPYHEILECEPCISTDSHIIEWDAFLWKFFLYVVATKCFFPLIRNNSRCTKTNWKKLQKCKTWLTRNFER